MLSEVEQSLNELRATKPLVLNLTNYVSMDVMANVLLALGAAPIMSTCAEELEELVKIASVVNINIGTLNDEFIPLALAAAKLAVTYQKPIILDPVGAGATMIRTKTAKELLAYATVVKGNASEILALHDAESKTLGVESVHTTIEAESCAKALAQQYNCIVIVSGACDFITDGKQVKTLSLGHPLMAQVTAMGCSLGAVVAAFCALDKAIFNVCVEAVYYFTACALAATSAAGPASFRSAFIDSLFAADFERLSECCDE